MKVYIGLDKCTRQEKVTEHTEGEECRSVVCVG
jgi:hypothetical protein